MNILVLNVGSSTLKFQLIDTGQEAIAANTDRRIARGQIAEAWVEWDNLSGLAQLGHHKSDA